VNAADESIFSWVFRSYSNLLVTKNFEEKK